MDYNPLYFMWLAEFDNGDCISQFNYDTGKEILWKNINVKRIKKLSWITIPLELSQKIFTMEGIYTHPSIISKIYSVEYENNEMPLIYRRNYIKFSKTKIISRKTKYILGKIKNNKKEIIYELVPWQNL